jgi:hypothetical protein
MNLRTTSSGGGLFARFGDASTAQLYDDNGGGVDPARNVAGISRISGMTSVISLRIKPTGTARFLVKVERHPDVDNFRFHGMRF